MAAIVDYSKPPVLVAEPLEYKGESPTDASATKLASSLLQRSPSSKPASEKQLLSSQNVNLKLADTVINYVKEKIPITINNLELCKPDFTGTDLERSDPQDTLDLLLEYFEIAFADCKFETYSKTAMQKIAKTALKYQIGTCVQLAAVGYNYCLENSVSQNVELFFIEGGNHVVLVIGRDPKSKPEDFKNWGPHAVVCDPWSRKAYPASKIQEELKDYQFQRFENGKFVSHLEPFDPKTQKLSLFLKD